jgi:hypothetical protein
MSFYASSSKDNVSLIALYCVVTIYEDENTKHTLLRNTSATISFNTFGTLLKCLGILTAPTLLGSVLKEGTPQLYDL